MEETEAEGDWEIFSLSLKYLVANLGSVPGSLILILLLRSFHEVAQSSGNNLSPWMKIKLPEDFDRIEQCAKSAEGERKRQKYYLTIKST